MRMLALMLAAFAALASAARAGGSADAQTLFVNHRADAMKVSVLLDRSGVLRPVSLRSTFHRGDQIKVAFESNFAGYVYVINVAPTRRATLMFPHAESRDNRVIAHARYELPPDDHRMEFDAETGTEVLLVVMARKPIDRFEAALHQGGTLTEQRPIYRSTLGSGLRPASPSQAQLVGELPARGLIFTHAATQGDFVAIKAAGSLAGRLGSGQVAYFEMHLRHR